MLPPVCVQRQELLHSPLVSAAGKYAADIQTTESTKEFRHFNSKSVSIRADSNQRHFEESKHWETYSTGLGNLQGALRAEFLETVSSQQHSANCLNACLHSPLQKDIPLTACTAHKLCCQQLGIQHTQGEDVALPAANLCVHSFAREMRVKSVATGSMLALKMRKESVVSSVERVILGVASTRPASQTFIILWPTHSNDVHSLLGAYDVPSINMSLPFFIKMIQTFGQRPDELEVEVYQSS